MNDEMAAAINKLADAFYFLATRLIDARQVHRAQEFLDQRAINFAEFRRIEKWKKMTAAARRKRSKRR